MLRSVKSLGGMSIQALDDQIGSVSDFYFDDQLWTVRYLVVDTGYWLPGRKVLLSPATIGALLGDSKSLPVMLTKEQIKNSPEIREDLPVSRQHEIALAKHYGWPYYWSDYAAAVSVGSVAYLPPLKTNPPAEPSKSPNELNYHLRSASEVTGYSISAVDGEIGHVEDFIVEDEIWMIRYMVIDTKNWVPGRKVLISPNWISGVVWQEKQVNVELLRDVIRECPEYDPKDPVNREYEVRLYDYYGRPAYWS